MTGADKPILKKTAFSDCLFLMYQSLIETEFRPAKAGLPALERP